MYRRLSNVGLLALIIAAPAPAWAWKPTTHVYLAEEALRDALDDGVVSIPVLENGRPQVPPVTRNYSVDPGLLGALRENTSQYRAGVMGPDAYPDIATGQQVVHPAHDDHLDNPVVLKGSDDWLQYLYQAGLQAPNNATKAFVTGYLTHAAGDVFGHTFVNGFSGGPFTVEPYTNAAKHLVIEGYVGKRTPRIRKWNASAANTASDFVTSGTFNDDYPDKTFFPSGDLSVDGVDLYGLTINYKLRTELRGLYLKRVNVASVPFIYNELGTELVRHIAWYFREKERLLKKIEACAWYDQFCNTRWRTAYIAHITAVWATKEYAKKWIVDIDVGLVRWPDLSHALALQLIYPSSDGDPANAGIDPTRYRRAKADGGRFLPQLLKMSGAPDDGVNVLNSVLKWVDRTFTRPKKLKELQDDITDWMLVSATGQDREQWAEYLSNPERLFDRVMGPIRPESGGKNITLAEMNQRELSLPLRATGQPDLKYDDPSLRFSVDSFNPAYNTLVLSKLILLGPQEFRRFVGDLPFTNPLSPNYVIPANAMLGYVSSLDGRGDFMNPRVASEIFNDCGAYNSVFKPQTGDDKCTVGLPALPLDPKNFSARPYKTSQVYLSWDASSGTTLYAIDRQSGLEPFVQIATVSAAKNTFLDTPRRLQAAYKYRLRAKNASGFSPGVVVTVSIRGLPVDPCKTNDTTGPLTKGPAPALPCPE